MAMDAFAVCLVAATNGYVNGARPRFRPSFHFGLFQFIMPVLGWLVGATIASYIQAFDHWIAFGLLFLVGTRLMRSGLSQDEEVKSSHLTRGWTKVILSVAVSIDALAVGLSLAVIGVFVWYPAILIGVVTGLISLMGLYVGNRLSERFGKVMSVVGGFLLMGIGVKILAEHLWGA